MVKLFSSVPVLKRTSHPLCKTAVCASRRLTEDRPSNVCVMFARGYTDNNSLVPVLALWVSTSGKAWSPSAAAQLRWRWVSAKWLSAEMKAKGAENCQLQNAEPLRAPPVPAISYGVPPPSLGQGSHFSPTWTHQSGKVPLELPCLR